MRRAIEATRVAWAAAPALFRRRLDHHQTGFAIGETLAHLHHLHAQGQVERRRGGAAPYRYRQT